MGIEIQRILRSAKRKEKGAIERGGGGLREERGRGGVKAEKKKMGWSEDRWYEKDGPQKWKETRATVAASRCVYAWPRIEEIYDARGPPAVYVLCRTLPPERFPLALSRPGFLSPSHDLWRPERASAGCPRRVHTARGRRGYDRVRESRQADRSRRLPKLRFSNGNAGCERSSVASAAAKQINFPFPRLEVQEGAGAPEEGDIFQMEDQRPPADSFSSGNRGDSLLVSSRYPCRWFISQKVIREMSV